MFWRKEIEVGFRHVFGNQDASVVVLQAVENEI